MDDIRTRELYSSPNGDRWHLCKDASGRVFVLHQANIPSGGQTSQIELGDFLTRGYGPEQQALFQMIGTVPVGNLRSKILMMQSAQNWHRQRATESLNSTRDRRVLVQ